MSTNNRAKKLGVSDADYEMLLEASDYACWICDRPERTTGRRLAVDHDHLTGAVRGLLCTSCNIRLGSARDPEWLRRAAEYLEVGARAFGSSCLECSHAAESRIVDVTGTIADGDEWVHVEHTCCGVSWKQSYAVRSDGLPPSWKLGGVPVPPGNRPPLRDPATIGHPGKRDCPCRYCEPGAEPPEWSRAAVRARGGWPRSDGGSVGGIETVGVDVIFAPLDGDEVRS